MITDVALSINQEAALGGAAVVVALASLCAATACGGGGGDATPRSHSEVDSCLRAASGVGDVDARSTPGDESTEGEDSFDWNFPPFSFSQASGGWVTADLGQGQGVDVLFYSTELEAERIRDELDFAYQSPGQVGNVVYGFEEEPTEEELNLVRSCVEANTA